MKVRRNITVVAVCLLWAWGSPALSAPATPSTQCSADDLNGDPRLGPRDLPSQGSVGIELTRYDRLAGLSPNEFLATYWDATANGGQGGWRYPAFNGFLVGPDGEPVEAPIPLRVGQQVDRYGSEFGAFLAPYGILYSQRAIPPQSLDNATAPGTCNYRLYKVLKEFRVDGGPIAPAFGQPGKGVQYMLVGSLVPGAPARLNVVWLVDNGYLQRLN
ncbi:MAG: hypothetical protein QOI99_984 [Actinomycetota bacterium]|jgi:hypothetical protein|nr:hypothetical protein [Actinomycetota bacterium]